MTKLIVSLICLLGYQLGSVGAAESDAVPLSKQQLTELLGSDRQSSLQWTKLKGVDATVYYGRNTEHPWELVGIYLGGFPPFMRDPSLPQTATQLGMYQVTWQKKEHEGLLHIETSMSLHSDYWKAMIWIEARTQAELDELTKEISEFPMFTRMPEIVGAP
jgi:hypothetical protein